MKIFLLIFIVQRIISARSADAIGARRGCPTERRKLAATLWLLPRKLVQIDREESIGRRFCQLLPILFFFLPALIASSSSHSTPLPTSHGCPSEMLQKCAEPLQQLGISSGKNLVLLLLQLHSPNQLRKSCLAYATALPCFRNLVHRCGVPSQTEILRQMENAHHFLCSPFSAVEQSHLLAHRVCIGRVLGEVGGGANCAGGGQNSSAMAVVLFRCRERCLAAAGEMSESAKFGCLLRAKCGREAAAFYTKMQRKIFHKKFPLICEPQNSRELAATAQIVVQSVGDEQKKSKKEPTAETKAAKSQSVTSATVPSQPTIFVISKVAHFI
uniref:Secreted protein n=1 Tax=Globodera rostochiensis TaxID=31243 RepID=A0A914GQ36_GLORO